MSRVGGMLYTRAWHGDSPLLGEAMKSMYVWFLWLAFVGLGCKSDSDVQDSGVDPKDSGAETASPHTGDTEAPGPACGNGIVEEGEACDDPSAPWLCWECQFTDCLDDSNWAQIAASLIDDAQYLPAVPEAGNVQHEENVAAFRLDRLAVAAVADDWVGDKSTCELSDLLPQERVTMGPLYFDEEGNPECQVQFSNAKRDGLMYVANRRPTGNTKAPVRGDPGWVTWQFDVPEGHESTYFRYQVDMSRLFGSHPTSCHENEMDEDGNCTRFLADDVDWSEEVDAGVYLLWGVPGECVGWHITGPHEPIEDMVWDLEEIEIEVPAHLRSVPELAVSALIWHQYPGGCENDYCMDATKTFHSEFSIGFGPASLQTEEVAPFAKEPVTSHPRLFGTDEEWYPLQVAYSDLPCRTEPDYPNNSDWGAVTNVRNQWELITLGGASCLGEQPATLAEHENAALYLGDGPGEEWKDGMVVQLLHLVRRTRACHALGESDCPFTLEEVDALVDGLIAHEMPRLPDEDWGSYSFGFDLFTTPPLRRWTLFADILWDELTPEQHQSLEDAFDPLVENFMTLYEEGHWALFNGNNWTPVLVNGALYWAVTYYHEDSRAPLLAKRALQTLWLHRDYYMPDGVYREGLSYAAVSFDGLLEINHQVERAFGEPLSSVYWERMPETAQWALDFMAPDGLLIDFGDSWAKRGWYSFTGLTMMLVNEGYLDAPSEPEPCAVQRFFSNKYYYHGMVDPWRATPLLARDWYSVVEDCDLSQQDGQVEISVHPDGGWGGIRTIQVGATELAKIESHSQRFTQADHTFLAVSAVPSSFIHTELDFGSIVWSAYGNRLLADSGYGDLNSNRYETEPDHPPDQNPTGHNTLVVPEALVDEDASTNSSQIEDEVGSMEKVQIGSKETIHLDGAVVYGRDNQDLGWLRTFDRWLLEVGDGNFLVVDTFAVREDREAAMVEERWHLYASDPIPTDCDDRSAHAESSYDATKIDILPVCSMLEKTVSSSQGRIVASSLQPGSFVKDPPVTFTNRLNGLEHRTRYRYVPDDPVDTDIRLFALLSSPVGQALPDASYMWTSCGAGQCVEISLPSGVWTLSFSWLDERWVLTDIVEP